MQVTVESPTKLQRRLTITVPAELMESALNNRLRKLSKTAKVKGFRPGNVPISHIKQLFGESARREALSEVIQSSLYEAIKEQKLSPVGVPNVEPTQVEAGQPIEYTATFEILPEIDTIHFDVNNLEKHITSVTDSDIDKVIDRLTEQHITWQEVDRAAVDKDQIVIDFKGSIDGKLFQGGQANAYPVVIGSKSMIPGFEEGLVGMKKGESKVIHVTFPENYTATEMAGKAAEFAIDAQKISEPLIPEMNDELVKKFGIKSGSIEELRAEIKKNLDREVARLTKAKLKSKVFDLLLAQNDFDIPQTLIEQEAKRIHDEMHPHHAGHDHGHTDEEMADFNDAAKRNVKLGLVMGAYLKQHNITPDKEKIKDHLTNLAASYENPGEVLKWYLEDKSRIAEVEMSVLEDQVVEKLLEGKTIQEISVPYSDFVSK